MKPIIFLLLVLFTSQPMVAQETIHMISLDSQPIIKGKLNGKTAHFLVDSGSDISIINLKDIKKYKINYSKMRSERYKLSGLNSEQTGEFLIANGMDLHLSSKKMEGCYWLIDLSKIARSLSDDSSIRINGIIGSDIMKSYNFVIDYEAEKIYFKSR